MPKNNKKSSRNFEQYNKNSVKDNSEKSPYKNRNEIPRRGPFQSPLPLTFNPIASTSSSSNEQPPKHINRVTNYYRKKKTATMSTQDQVDTSLKEAAGVPAASGDSTNPGFQYIKRPRDSKTNI